MKKKVVNVKQSKEKEEESVPPSKDTVKSESPKKRNSSNTLMLYGYGFIFFLAIFLVAGVFGYFFRSEIKSEICSVDFGRVMLEDALKITSCEPDAQAEENNDPSYSITIGKDESDLESIQDVSDIFEQANPSVVGIGIVGGGGSTDDVIGSGFVVSPEGLIATNQHVVSELDAVYFVKLPDVSEIVEIEEIYRDAVNDIAILKVDQNDLPALPLAEEDEVRPGQAVVAIGNPLGELNSTVTSGIVSGINRTVELGSGTFLRTRVRIFEGTIQTDAAINPGNSGGPLLNANGEVIGINFATISGADNLSFALPVSILKTRLGEINEFGRFRIPYIGISYDQRLVQVGTEVFVGAVVAELDPDGSAIDVLEVGDIVIEVDDITLDRQALADIVQRQDIGDFVEFEVVRDGQRVIELVEIIERE